MNDYALMSVVLDTCLRIALLLLDNYWIKLTCNMEGVAGEAAHAYP